MSVGDTRYPRTTAGTVLVLVELLCLGLSAPPLYMAVYVMSNLVGVHDNSALNYSIFAGMYATPGVLLLALALGLRTRGRLSGRARSRRRRFPVDRLASLRSSEWTWAVAVLFGASVVWRLYLVALA